MRKLLLLVFILTSIIPISIHAQVQRRPEINSFLPSFCSARGWIECQTLINRGNENMRRQEQIRIFNAAWHELTENWKELVKEFESIRPYLSKKEAEQVYGLITEIYNVVSSRNRVNINDFAEVKYKARKLKLVFEEISEKYKNDKDPEVKKSFRKCVKIAKGIKSAIEILY